MKRSSTANKQGKEEKNGPKSSEQKKNERFFFSSFAS